MVGLAQLMVFKLANIEVNNYCIVNNGTKLCKEFLAKAEGSTIFGYTYENLGILFIN